MRLFLFGATGLLFAGCSGNAQLGDGGPQVSRDYPVSAFQEVSANGAYDVTITTGKAPTVRAEGTQAAIDALQIEVQNGRLTIRSEPNNKWKVGREAARISVTVPALTRGTLAGAGDLVIDRVTGDRFEGSVSGAGDLRIGEVAVSQLSLSLAGAGDIEAAGRTREGRYSVAGAGNMRAPNLTAETAEASVSGAGNISTRVTGTARATVSGVGDIEISGGARCQQRTSGMGEVRCS